MQATPLSFNSSDGFTLYGLHFVRASKKQKSIAIFVHGAGNSNIISKGLLLSTLADSLQAKQHDLVAFNNRGSGYVGAIKRYDTEGAVAEKRMSGMAYERIAECIEDLDGIIDWAVNQGYDNVVLIGHSTGANKLVLYANSSSTRLKYVQKLFLLAGGDDITLQNSWLEDSAAYLKTITSGAEQHGPQALVPEGQFYGGHPISYGSLVELLTEHSDYDIFPFGRYQKNRDDLFTHIRALTIPTIAIYGTRDFGTVVPVKDALEILRSVLPAIQTEHITNAEHDFWEHEQELAQIIAASINP
ncbi:alpha/beta fold hydrolase [Candidatus Saccharibacteria bacterium]|nr:alpha/beta fold hydrolase [Candidatus Saccharibacteria bacterium]